MPEAPGSACTSGCRTKLDPIDAGHVVWEDAADEYAALVTSWRNSGQPRVARDQDTPST